MLQFINPRKTRHVAIGAALLTFVTAGVAVAQQDGVFPSLPPAQGGVRVTGNVQNLQAVITRAAQLNQAARLRVNVGPTGARSSYSAASQAFGEMLSSFGNPPSTGVPDGTQAAAMPTVSSEQAASDVRALKSAARQAGSAMETDRLNKAASLYATGAKEFLTGQLREALLETGAQPVVLRGDPRAAEAARKQAVPAPKAPKVEPPKPPAPAKPNPPVNPDTPEPQLPNPPQDPNTPPVNPNNPPTNPTVPPGNPAVPPSNPVPPVPTTPPK